MAVEALIGAGMGVVAGGSTAWALVAKTRADARKDLAAAKTAEQEAETRHLVATTSETQAVLDGWKDMTEVLTRRLTLLDERAVMQDHRIDRVQAQADKCDEERASLVASLAAAGILDRRDHP